MRSPLFWDVTHTGSYWCFQTNYWFHLQRSSSLREMSVTYYQSMLHNITEEWRSQLHLLLQHHQGRHWNDAHLKISNVKAYKNWASLAIKRCSVITLLNHMAASQWTRPNSTPQPIFKLQDLCIRPLRNSISH